MKIQIVILSRDRPEFLKMSIDSVIAQNKSSLDVELIVSDNSESINVANMIKDNYETGIFKVITRKPSLSSKDHFDIVISELNEKYAVLFHDDDVMHPDYVNVMCSLLENTNQIVSAVGCNALIFKKYLNKTKGHMHSFRSIKSFDNKRDFLSQYLFGNGGKAPFPGYLYDTKFLKKISITELPCGKHGDVTLLGSLLEYGRILWIPDTLMYLRVHNSNDNNTYNVANRISLLNYIVSNGLKRDDDLIVLFRCDYFLKWLLGQKLVNIFSWKNKTVFKFLFFKTLYFMNKYIFWKGIASRIKKDLL